MKTSWESRINLFIYAKQWFLNLVSEIKQQNADTLRYLDSLFLFLLKSG